MTPVGRVDGWFTNVDPALRHCWHPVCRASDVGSDPVAVELLGEAWCVVRIDGRLVAMLDECPHRFAPLSAGHVVDGALQCPYHGYRFGPDGRCVEIPSSVPGTPVPARLGCSMPAAITEHLGLVWIAPDPPTAPLPLVPEHHDASFVHVPLAPMDWHASAAQMADNFLDVSHFPFLHLDTFGAPDDRVVGDYEVVRDGWTFSVDYVHLTKALADSHDPSGGYRVVERRDHFVFTAPHHVYLRIEYADEQAVLAISFCHQPLADGRTRLWCTDYRNDIVDDQPSIDAAAAFQLAVASEDRALLQRNRRKGVPLQLTTEFHTRADRITVEMRRVLADLVSAHG